MENLKEELIEFIRDEFLDEEDEDMEIDENTSLLTSGIVDSFSMVSLKIFLEKKFSITIPDAKAGKESFDTIGKIIKVIEELT